MKDVFNYLERLIKKEDVIVLACSGGPDSMCLLSLLCSLKEKIDFQIIVAHVNHKLRKESEEEATFVKKVCEEKNLIYEYMEILEYNHDNLENDARMKRYAFFDQLINKYHGKYLFTAHHADDLMETILMRLVRGSSLKGYSGFKKEYPVGNYQIIRPFITLTKEEIKKYMDEHHYSYRIDESNFSNLYTRNRYRMNILPFLKEEQPMVHKKFLKFSEELNEVNIYFDRYIQDLLKTIRDEKGIQIDALLKLDPFLLKEVVEYTLSEIYVDDLFLIHDKHTQNIIGLIRSKKSNLSITLPNHYLAVKSYNYYRIVHITNSIEYKIEIQEEVSLPNGGIIKRVNSSEEKSNYVIRLNSKEVKLPLFVRNRYEGDKMEVKNLNGHKKIKSIFIDEKIEKSLRESIPVVVDGEDNILWLAGVKKSKFDVEKDGIYDIILSYEREENDK